MKTDCFSPHAYHYIDMAPLAARYAVLAQSILARAV